ncbi:MAG: hypothetical protein HQK76_15485 [Desulfobacterales bacterium]|nr:hypothetical protein [Desulfobacterales bacterium]
MNRYFTTKNILNLFLSAAIVFLITFKASAQDTNASAIINAIGKINIDNNIAAARDKAINNGIEKAVTQILIKMLPIEVLVSNFSNVSKILEANLFDFILDYKILGEFKTDKTYSVIIEATVAKAKINQLLENYNILIAGQKLPSIIIIAGEQSGDETSVKFCFQNRDIPCKSYSESAMLDIFKAKGFNVIPSKNISITTSENNSELPIEIDEQTALEIGTKLHAEIVVIGKTIAQLASNTMGDGKKSFNAEASFTAIRTSNKEKLGSTSQTGVSINIDTTEGSIKSVATAGKMAAEDLSNQILSAWKESSTLSSKFDIIVKGSGNLANFVMFRRILSEIKGVKNISTNAMKYNESSLSLDFNADSNQLAEAILKENFMTFGVNITEVLPNKLVIELIPSKKF